ncbi:her7 isoform X1 [Oryzias latipes]|uniref:her7 isoform X1 n=1 Tax=Oryzias latipes TaxID=8090 RepID=UPI000CE1FF45|nr:her7 isoform X1 [Oryzias latipes]
MKLLQDQDESTSNRKLLKSQVEKRRRERMNRSLERLRTMLLPEPHQVGSDPLWVLFCPRADDPLIHAAAAVAQVTPKHRVEKAEILEHTVIFLQKTTKEQTRSGQKQSFRDGFSTCLRRASRFLGPQGKGLWLGPALDATFSTRLARSDFDSSGLQTRSFSSLQHTRSLLQKLRQKSKDRLRAQVFGAPPVQQSQARAAQPHRHERAASKDGSAQSGPLSQTLWRPWP